MGRFTVITMRRKPVITTERVMWDLRPLDMCFELIKLPTVEDLINFGFRKTGVESEPMDEYHILRFLRKWNNTTAPMEKGRYESVLGAAGWFRPPPTWEEIIRKYPPPPPKPEKTKVKQNGAKHWSDTGRPKITILRIED